MLYGNRTDISKGLDLTKSVTIGTTAKNLWFVTVVVVFFNQGFTFQDSVCNDCHDVIMLSGNISDFAIITIKNVDYCCIIHSIRKSEAITLLKSSVLEDRGFI